MSKSNLPAGLAGLLTPSGSLNSHPVTLPDVVLKYEQKDITADIKPYLMSVSYTDYLGDQSDELQIEVEDVDGRWLRTWYPDQGDSLSLEIGDQFTGMVKMGSFELAEIEYQHPPSVVRLKALATGITRSNRTLKPKVYRDITLAKIVRQVAQRLKLSVTGTVADIKIDHVTQYQERDVEFLARLAREYGHTFKIVDRTLVFHSNVELAKQEPVTELLPADIKTLRLRDLIKGVPEEAVVTGYDARRKQVRRQRRRNTPLRPGSKRTATTDTLKIVANRGESDQQLAARADAALNDAKQSQVAGSITLVGHAKLVAGQVVQLRGFGKLSGKYLVKQSRHDIRRMAGYVTTLEVRMVEYVPDEVPAAVAETEKQEAGHAAGL
ncbi:phage late control D family protein [Neisseria shayeganii]|uniref:Phage protein n=1 Tax=Neisseria shayeganii 871 TaxID=1032488 RepID=G4CJF0_9NEIS|nr:contractile injection system protein, VgrG/Pvc8 family [Neisseria shayeganii]EGY52001.1 phage protein [Neisseria shayeganii 871]